MNIPWDDLQIFLAVAESGSLSAAAKQLRVGQPTISRRLAQLEYQLGYQLFRRQAWGASLTARGERLLEPAKKMAEWAGEVTRAASKAEAAPRGVVRVTAPPGVAFDFVAPFAAWMKKKHPQIRVELLSSIQYLDLARGEADLALRLRKPSHSDLTVVATLEHANSVYVSKAYAQKLPKRISFTDVDWLAWAPPYEELAPNPQLAALIPNFEPAFTTDSFIVMLRAAEAGLGAIILGKVRHRFTEHKLVPLDLDLGPHNRSELHLVAAKSALDIPRVRLTADLLAEELARAEV